MTMLGSNVVRYEEAFRNVVALYTALVENRQYLRVKQVEINAHGEVSAEPMDFIFDVEKKAKRTLTPFQYTLFQVYASHGHPEFIPVDTQLALGTVWYETQLDIDGPYRSLYFRVKNRMDRERIHQETTNGTGDTSNGYV